MSAPIVVGFDPEGADAPLQFGIAAGRFTGAPLVVVAVHGGRDADTQAVDRLSMRLANEPDIQSELRSIEAESAARALTETLESEGAGLAVVGATSRGAIGRGVLGSTADRVIHGAPCPVAVIPQGFASGDVGTVGVAYNPTPEGEQALRSGVVLAEASGAALRVITVLHERIGTLGPEVPGQRAMEQVPQEMASRYHAAARETVDAALADADAHIDAEVELVYGDPADSLLGFTGSLDLLVMGSRAYGPRRAVLLGGVSRRVTAESRCPVVVLPREAESPLRELVATRGRAQPEA